MIRIEDLTIRNGNFTQSDLNISLENGQYGVLMGPSGCGKTTLLETICGLRFPTAGKVIVNSVDVTKLAPAQRQISYVPQDLALFPNMTVGKQIEFGLEIRKAPKSERRQRVDELAQLMGIAGLLSRLPADLSGGEKQRVALARALSFRPTLLCLDEPLSSLDDTTRNRMTDLLAEIHRTEKVTVLHVTHNQQEAKRLGTVSFEMPNNEFK